MKTENVTIRYLGNPYYVALTAPDAYWGLDTQEKKRICNGCGPSGAMFDLIPDTVFFLKIGEACNIHDFCYHIGETEEDRKKADDLFLDNISMIVRKITNFRWLKLLRLRRAYTYFLAVQIYGKSAFNN